MNEHLSERDLLRVEIPEARYQIDMKLFDDGQKLSAELLKLSLAGVAVVGVFLQLLSKPPVSAGLTDRAFKLLFSSSVMAFAISAAVALLQRFYASSGMFHHIKAMKVAVSEDPSGFADTERELATRLGKFTRAHSLLKAAAILLSLGAALMAGAFIRLMFTLPKQP
jgi:hypothetical protein